MIKIAEDSGSQPSYQTKVGFRFVAMLLGSLSAIFLTFVSDPDTAVLFTIPLGSSTLLLVKSLAYFALAALMIHLGSKTMFDYIDRSRLIDRAVESGQAGHVLIALSIYTLAFAWIYSTLINVK